MPPRQTSTDLYMGPTGVEFTDGSGERYAVVGYSASFMAQSLDRPDAPVIPVSSAVLRELGVSFDGSKLEALR